MLNERRNLLGRRDGGPAGFLTAARGEPLELDEAVELRRKGLGLEEAKREPLEVGRLRSWGGEAAKHSSRLNEDELWLKSPHPNWKGAFSACLSCSLKDTELVELFLERAREGLRRADFRRLRYVSTKSEDRQLEY